MDTLKAEKRSLDVKAKKLRREGYVTGNVFGRKIETSIPVQMSAKEVRMMLRDNHKGSQIKLDIEGKKYNVLIKEVDYNVLLSRIDDISFQALVSNERVNTVAEVVLVNHDELQEGILQIMTTEISYAAYPSALVDRIEIDVADLKVGDNVKVSDLPLASNPEIVLHTDPETVLVTVTAVNAAALEADEAAAEGAEGEEEAAEEAKED